MKEKIEIIGLDHGYGNVKTAHCCFPTGVIHHKTEPTFKSNLLIFEEKYYTIGEGHKEFLAQKQTDIDYYLLTLAAVGRELYARNLRMAQVHLAAGLPLTWVGDQKAEFQAYLLQKEHVDFTFKGIDFSVDFVGADIFPQGFAAVAEKLHAFDGTNLLCDIGNGTMSVLQINNRKPVQNKSYTEKYGTHQCMLAVREALMRKFNVAVDESVIESVLRFGTADIAEKYLSVIRETATAYVAGIFRKLREHEYHPDLMKLYVVGGGGCLIKNFGVYDKARVTINDDICATAKGYEYLSRSKFQHSGGMV
jgi:plasmid segregation protein ParM